MITTIMVMNYKKCRAMKKFITSILIAAAALTACTKSDEVTLNNPDKVSFTATAELPQSRSVLVEEAGKYHAEWVAGDYLELYEITITGGTKKKASNPNTTLAEGGKTATVQFELTANTTADSFAYILAHNNASINGSATYLAFTVPNNQAPTAMNTYDPLADLIMSKGVSTAAQPTETLNFEMNRVTALAKISIKNLALAAGDAVKSVTFTCEQVITGKKTNLLTEDIIAGIDPLTSVKDSSPVHNHVVVTLPEPQAGDFSCYASLWPATLASGSKCTITVATNNDGNYTKEISLPKDMVFTSGDITAFTVNMAGIPNSNATPEQPVELPKYVTVAGIKWATGNLEYEKDTTTDGFAAGWKIAPSQEHHFQIGMSGDNTSLTSYDQVSHFNFGGIGQNALHIAHTSAVHIPAPADGSAAFDFSGKMYTDQDCTVATTDFAAAKYGDVAYWASNGKYRMPTKADMEKLYLEACCALASYNDVDGTYFFDPAQGQTPGIIEDKMFLKAEDMKVGLFLPNAGRGYDNKDYTLYNINTLGIYRTSTVQENSKATPQGYGVIYRVSKQGEGDFFNKTIRSGDVKTYAYGACGRYCIRPIYIE